MQQSRSQPKPAPIVDKLSLKQQFKSLLRKLTEEALPVKVVGFVPLWENATAPTIADLCEFEYPEHVYLGSHVTFLRAASVLADPSGRIEIGDSSTVCRFCILQSAGGTIRIGKNTLIGDFCNLYGQGGLEIGDDVMISACVQIVPNQHRFDDPSMPISRQPCRSQGIVIRDGVWVGANSVILDGVTIGQGAVVGAGSVVTRDIPDYGIAVGVPAKIIRYRPGLGDSGSEGPIDVA